MKSYGMKINLIIVLLLMSSTSFAQKNQSHYKSEIDFGNGTVFSTFLDVTIAKDEFKITSPKNADVRMLGWTKARLARIIGKSPKKGIIISIKGKQISDSLIGETKIPMFGELRFKGVIKNEILVGEFYSNDTISVGSLNGVNTTEKRNEYNYLYPLLLQIVQDNIYSKDALKTKEWNKFQKQIEKLCNSGYDDIELFLGFNIQNQKLPFTHLSLFISQDEVNFDQVTNSKNSVVFEEKNDSTAYVLIKDFSSSKDELAIILPRIVENENYKNLIIDLRDNGGGGLDPAFEFAKYIVNKDMEVGYFVTNKLQNSGYEPDLFKTLPELQPKSNKEFTNDLKTTSGVKLIFKKPENPVFKGNLYLLTNGNTASTCEPIVYALKNNGSAIVIGEKTYGGMLAGSPFDISGKYRIMLPIADFYTYDGIRLDKVGVIPDIEVKSEEALEKALEIINSITK